VCVRERVCVRVCVCVCVRELDIEEQTAMSMLKWCIYREEYAILSN